jgi:hypothetical protein
MRLAADRFQTQSTQKNVVWPFKHYERNLELVLIGRGITLSTANVLVILSKVALRKCNHQGTLDPVCRCSHRQFHCQMERAFPHLPLRGIRLNIEISQTPYCEVVHKSTHVHIIFNCHHVRILPYCLHTQAKAKFCQLLRVRRCEAVLNLKLPYRVELGVQQSKFGMRQHHCRHRN